MPKYITRREVVNAEKWTGNNHAEIFEFLVWEYWDKRDNSAAGSNFSIDNTEGGNGVLYINVATPVTIGDYIIKNNDGSLVIVSQSVFDSKYILA